jgi:hypothetical protein
MAKTAARAPISAHYGKLSILSVRFSFFFDATKVQPPWKPMGTLWKDFSSVFPFQRLRAGSQLAVARLCSHMLIVFNMLIESRFKNLSLCPNPLWKSDCDCDGGSLKAPMGNLWR